MTKPNGKGAASRQTFTARELELMEFPEISYVVPNHIVEGLTLLAGKPKVGKSWLALDLSLAVAYGGIACGSIQCEAGDTLYCALEDNPRRLQRRMRQLLPRSDWPDRLQLRTTLPRLNAGGLDELRRWAEVAKKPKLIVLDTFACIRPHRSSKDNAYEADYAALSPLQRIASELSLAIVVVHHLRKLESEDPLDTISGTTALAGAADSVLVLRRDAGGVTLYGRGRDIDDIEDAMELDRTTGHWTILGEASKVRKSEARKIILDTLRGEDEMSVSDLTAATGMERNALDQLLWKMVRNAEVKKTKRGHYGLP
jgi:DNA-binding transcriptional ArsR family regulator